MSVIPNSINLTTGGVLPNYFFVDCKSCAFSAGNFQSEAEADRERLKIHGKCPECGGDVVIEKRAAQVRPYPESSFKRITF